MNRLHAGLRCAVTTGLLIGGGCLAEAWAQMRPLPREAGAAEAALRVRDRKSLSALVAPLRETVRDRASAATPLLLTWGRTEREVGSPDSALTAFMAVAERADAGGAGLLEQARLLLARQMPEGAELWYAGLAVADAGTLAEYRRDLAPLFSPAEAAAFDNLASGSARIAWLRAFWDARDQRDLRNPGERLLEHYRRLDYVRAKFPLPDKKRQYLPGAAYRAEDAGIDDRGVIYLRHGGPTQVSRAGGEAPNAGGIGSTDPVPPNETWRYASPTGDRFYTFRACAALGRRFKYEPGVCVPPLDYQLVESVLDIFGPTVTRRVASGAATLRGRDSLLPSEVELTVLARANMGERFQRLLVADRFGLPAMAAEEREAGRVDVRVGTTTDSYEHRFARDLDARIEVLAAGRNGPRSLVHVTYAIKAGDVRPSRAADGWLYPVRVRLQVRNAQDSVLASLDERRAFRSAVQLGARESILGRVALDVPPGTHTLRVVLEHDEDTGSATGPVSLVVPGTTVGTLTGSDLVLGHGEIPLVWLRAPDDTVRFNPTGSFAPAAGLELYHELYGLEAGQTYRYQLTVSREKGGIIGKVLGGDVAALTLSGEERATGSLTPVRRYLDISRLAAGRYSVTVEYEAPGVGKLKRSRGFEVREPR